MRKLKLLASLLAILGLTSGWLIAKSADAQGSERLWTSVRTDALPRLASSDSTIYRITGADSDTSTWIVPWKWTGIVGVVAASSGTHNLQAQAWCGNKVGANYIAVKCDSMDITAAGDFVWQLNIPVSTRLQIIFSSGSTANGTTTVDSVNVNRNW